MPRETPCSLHLLPLHRRRLPYTNNLKVVILLVDLIVRAPFFRVIRSALLIKVNVLAFLFCVLGAISAVDQPRVVLAATCLSGTIRN